MTERESADRADAIAREIALRVAKQAFAERQNLGVADYVARFAEPVFAAALRSYGREMVDAKLEEVRREIDWRASLLPVRSAKRSGLLSLIPFIDSLKSKPEAQDTQT